MHRLFFLTTLTLFVFGISLLSVHAQEPQTKKTTAPKARKIPPELRIRLWSKFLEENPDTPHRVAILEEIDRALAEMWEVSPSPTREGKTPKAPGALPSLESSYIVDPFAGSAEDAEAAPDPSSPKNSPSEQDEIVDPFASGHNKILDPFASRPTGPKGPPQKISSWGYGISDPFEDNTASLRRGKLLDPFAGPPHDMEADPDPFSQEDFPIENGKLINPFRAPAPR